MINTYKERGMFGDTVGEPSRRAPMSDERGEEGLEQAKVGCALKELEES